MSEDMLHHIIRWNVVFIFGLVYMGFTVSRQPSPDVSAPMQTIIDTPPMQTIRLEACVNNDC